MKSQSLKQSGSLGKKIALIVISLYGVILLFPIYWMFCTAFKDSTRVLDFPPSMWPNPATLESFKILFSQPLFLRWAMNSAIYACCATAGQLFFCTLAGYALAKIEFPGRKLIFWLNISLYWSVKKLKT